MMREIRVAIDRAVITVRRQISMMIARGEVERVDDSKPVQLAQATFLEGETRQGLEHVQPYGWNSHPLPGAKPAVALFAQGDRHQGLIIVAGDRRYRLAGLAPGEVAIFDDQGQSVSIRRDRIEVDGKKVVIVGTGNVEVTASGKVSIDAAGDVDVTAGGQVNLGGPGGAPVARIGDLVDVGSGSSAGQWPIVSGSEFVKAAG